MTRSQTHAQKLAWKDRMTVRNALIQKIRIPVLIGVIALFLPFAGETRESVLERADIDISSADLNNLISELTRTTATAESALADVKNMKLVEAKKAIDDLYDQLKIDINHVLDRLSPNSVLMDNLEGATANMIALQHWFERQSADYPRRDSLLMRIAEVIKGYEESAEAIQSGRKGAQDALRELMRAQHYQRMEAKVEMAEISVDATRSLVLSLQALSEKIQKLSERESGPEAIPN